jgi:hypothetical protein
VACCGGLRRPGVRSTAAASFPAAALDAGLQWRSTDATAAAQGSFSGGCVAAATQGVAARLESRTRDDGTGSFNDEYTVSGGNTQDL